MATIQSCPPKILFKIIESSLPLAGWRLSHQWDQIRRGQLRSTALVARDWREPSQMLLWREITMWDGTLGYRGDWVLDAFVKEATPGLYRTAKLHLNSVSPDRAAALLSYLRGIEYLIISLCTTPTSLFLSPALSGLRELNIHGGQPNREHVTIDLTIRLDKLVLDPAYWINPSVASLVASSRHSLTHLDFYITESSAELFNVLQVVTPNLRTLIMPGFFEADSAPLTRFFDSDAVTVTVDKFTQASTPGLYRTARVHLYAVTLEQTTALVSHLRGVAHLRAQKTGVDTRLFCLPALSQLKTLELYQPIDYSREQELDINIKLKEMSILWASTIVGGTLLSLLDSSRHSLTDLTLQSTRTDVIIHSLHLVAPNLTSLTLPERWHYDSTLLTRFYDACGTLERLAVFPHPSLIDPLLTSTIKVSRLGLTEFNASKEALHSLIRVVRETRVLEGGSLELSGLQGREEEVVRAELLGACALKGVTMV
ncbi:hypothetical protein MNV49_004506 [Pseudohyphozyma bogoriensis]|nr:hypothetical protein MNV49_004506 [Pseudohyphozyma bogoriensis]